MEQNNFEKHLSKLCDMNDISDDLNNIKQVLNNSLDKLDENYPLYQTIADTEQVKNFSVKLTWAKEKSGFKNLKSKLLNKTRKDFDSAFATINFAYNLEKYGFKLIKFEPKNGNGGRADLMLKFDTDDCIFWELSRMDEPKIQKTITGLLQKNFPKVFYYGELNLYNYFVKTQNERIDIDNEIQEALNDSFDKIENDVSEKLVLHKHIRDIFDIHLYNSTNKEFIDSLLEPVKTSAGGVLNLKITEDKRIESKISKELSQLPENVPGVVLVYGTGPLINTKEKLSDSINTFFKNNPNLISIILSNSNYQLNLNPTIDNTFNVSSTLKKIKEVFSDPNILIKLFSN